MNLRAIKILYWDFVNTFLELFVLVLYHANSATNDCPSSRDKDMMRRGHNTLERTRSLSSQP